MSRFSGKPPVEQRGKHGNVANRIPEETRQLIKSHILSIRGEKSHYGTQMSCRLYFPAELNQNKVFNLFKEKHPDVTVIQKSWRKILMSDFNISFGYPRSDTISASNEYQANKRFVKTQLSKKRGDAALT